jgi:UDP-N-acetylglucosamine 2-epimerase (non-hydrolysing)
MKPKILLIFGTRPEAIKMAPLIKALQQQDRLDWEVCVTAQHREMLDQVLELFDLPVHYDLDLMHPNQSLSRLSARILRYLPEVLDRCHPSAVLVHGDTTTSFVAALCSFYGEIEIGHVEAGLRTYDLHAPFPEEANRQLTARLVRWHFAPTPHARDNLLSEHLASRSIHVTGNSVIDALHLALQAIDTTPQLKERIFQDLEEAGYLPEPSRNFILITGHRRENFGEGFRRIFTALAEIARRRPELDLVYPLHLNPRVRELAQNLLGEIPNIHLIRPLEYGAFIHLMRESLLILTDSGGIQEEAPSLGKPVLVLRESTERPEALEAGTVKLVGSDPEKIVEETCRLINDPKAYHAMANAVNPYGDGHAAERIVAILSQDLSTVPDYGNERRISSGETPDRPSAQR